MKIPVWKPLLIVLVVAGCFALMYPPNTKLKPGLDLAGGTTLVYEVDVPAGASTRRVVEDTISTLKKRVDPNGVRNLIWRPQAGNRIEIQMPAAAPVVAQRRNDFLTLEKQLLAGNLSQRAIESALRLEADARNTQLDHIAGDNAQLRDDLAELAAAADRLAQAKAPYQELNTKRRALDRALAELGADASESDRKKIDKQIAAIQSELISATRTYLDAQRNYEQSESAVFQSNIDAVRLASVLDALDEPKIPSKVEQWRTSLVEPLLADHPHRSEQIETLIESFLAYAQVKGPLDDPEDLKALLSGSGVLEFRIAAGTGNVADVASYFEQLEKSGPRAGLDRPYRWFEIDDLEQFTDGEEEALADLLENPTGYLASSHGLVGGSFGGKIFVLLGNSDTDSMTPAKEGWEVNRAIAGMDQRGFPAVDFSLNAYGGSLMAQLTGPHKGEPMAVVLDEKIITTPRINDQLSTNIQISGGRGGFSQVEQGYLTQMLNAGSLQGRLTDQPISEKTTGAQFGADNLRRGFQAATYSLIIVAIFMLAYYLFWGVLADIALACNMIMIMGIMAMFEATFTLPGIAGIVLTIGMAVDANVLIYERIREEREAGADLRTAIRLGYGKAFWTIFDANVTTMITCVVLFYTGTAEIKGFALTLMIGILSSMFTALFVTRVIVDYIIAFVRPKKLPMLPTVVKPIGRLLSPNVNWIGLRKIFFGCSAVLMIAGVVCMFERGQDLYDIEFRSGTSVTFALTDGAALSVPEVRERLNQVADELDSPELRGDRVSVVTIGQTDEDKSKANEFSIATLVQDPALVSRAIKTAFADVLDSKAPIAFPAQDGQLIGENQAPVYPLVENDLGANIRRPDVGSNVHDYVGGVAIVIEDMTPSASVADISQRIENMRRQPAYENLIGRQFNVIGLDLDPNGATNKRGESLYRTVAIVTRDLSTNYVENPQTFAEPIGLAATEWNLVRDALQRDTSLGSVANFSSQVSNTMKQQAIVALLLSLIAVVAYIWVRFGSLRYGVAAIIALLHDVLITLGMVAISAWIAGSAFGDSFLLDPFRIDLAMVAAVLTIVGYSLNDTIVVFDRIRENRGRLATASPEVINLSINQTISRTVLTSCTTLLAIFILFTFGGPGVHGFAFAMFVGIFIGTYSSIAIAAPVLMIGQKSPTSE